ncbi:hypothetical protein [Paenibacillus pinistramenti]|nr:hypothetical protein [Paenibacillus pinistramenti]
MALGMNLREMAVILMHAVLYAAMLNTALKRHDYTAYFSSAVPASAAV